MYIICVYMYVPNLCLYASLSVCCMYEYMCDMHVKCNHYQSFLQKEVYNTSLPPNTVIARCNYVSEILKKH